MKRYIPTIAIGFLLGVCALFFYSCTSGSIRDAKQPVTVLIPDPTPVRETNRASTARQGKKTAGGHTVHSRKPHKILAMALPAAQAAPPASKVIPVPAGSQHLSSAAAMVPSHSNGFGNDWLWLLLLLLLLALGSWLWSRYRRGNVVLARDRLTEKGFLAVGARMGDKKILAKDSGLIHKGISMNSAALAHKANQPKRAGLTHDEILAKHERMAHKVNLAKRARLAHNEVLANRAKLARLAILAKRSQAARKIRLANRARLARDRFLANRTRLAHNRLLAKRARLAHQNLIARRSQLARKIRLANRARLAHDRYLANRARLAHNRLLAKRARLAHKVLLAKRNRLAHKKILTKVTGLTREGIIATSTPLAHKGKINRRARRTHKRISARDTGLANKRAITISPELAPQGSLAKPTGLPVEGDLTTGAEMARKGLLAKQAGLADNEILVEGAGLTKVIKVSIKSGDSFQKIIVSVARIGNFPAKKAHLFLEDEDLPLDPNRLLDAKHPRHKIHHVHTQTEIGVVVYFNGLEHKANFSPATTIRKVLAWATPEFKISGQEAREARLSIPGSTESLQHTDHIGRFVPHNQNQLSLNVTTPRVVSPRS